MPYRVFWSPDAERLFKNLHAAASSDAAALLQAASAIDTQLHENPHKLGESRQENVRIGFQQPLAVKYEVLEDVKTVVVFDVWRTDSNRP